MKKSMFYVLSAILMLNLNSFAANNSPCQNPYAQSYTVCEYNNCTTYCDSNMNTGAVIVRPRNYSFSYSSPYGSFRVSNEFFGINISSYPMMHRRPMMPVHHMPPPPLVRPQYYHHTNHVIHKAPNASGPKGKRPPKK